MPETQDCRQCQTKQQILNLDRPKKNPRFPEDYACKHTSAYICWPEYARCCPGFKTEMRPD